MTEAAAATLTDLSHALQDGLSANPVHGAPRIAVRTISMGVVEEISLTSIECSVHAATHLDAPRHFLPAGAAIEDVPLEHCHGRGVVLDVRREGPVAVTAADLEQAEGEIRRGDIVLLCLGYGHRFSTEGYAHHPYLTLDAAELLLERGIRMLGVDTMTPDMPIEVRADDFDFPVHRTLLGAGILIAENLGPGLLDLLGRRVVVSALPILVAGADGAPARIVASPQPDAGEER